MNWEQLLSASRLGGEIQIPYKKNLYDMSEFEKDYWRIIDCASFRRLQDKTQVFPLDKSDFVRTRLTHSLEVSSIGRQLVSMIYRALNSGKYKSLEACARYPLTAQQAQDAAEVVACAGLLHDIGNPPFGHFGEDAVHAWFENHLSELSYEDQVTGETIDLLHGAPQEIVEDLKHFEGNAQAFRLLTKLHHVDSERGLNLTAAVLNTIVKYPTDSLHIKPKDPNVCLHKLGCYDADQADFRDVTEKTGTFFDGEHHRHPLTFILEAADDIAYATADLEDSFKKGLFTLDEFEGYFSGRVKAAFPKEREKDADSGQYLYQLIEALDGFRKGAETPLQAFQCWINHVRHWLIYCAAYGFTVHYADIMEGRFRDELIEGTFHEQTMAILKAAMGKYTYPAPGVIKLELAAETILEGLLERFVPAAIDTLDGEVASASRLAKRKAEKKLMTLVPENLKAAYFRSRRADDPTYNLYLRVLMIADFVSDMTDGFAKSLYQELSGI